MKWLKCLSLIFLIFLFIPAYSFGGQIFNPFTNRIDLCSSIRETDSSPSADGCQTILVGNGSLTDNGDGTFSLSTSGGSGDITSVGDVASGAAFDGTQGTTLTFFNVSGNQTISFDNTTQDYEVSNDITITDATPHIRLTDSTTSEDDYEWYADTNNLILANVTDKKDLIRIDPNNALYFPSVSGSGYMKLFGGAVSTQTIPIPIADGGTNNALAYTSGSVIYSNGTKLTEDNSNFFWGFNGNKQLLIGPAPSDYSIGNGQAILLSSNSIASILGLQVASGATGGSGPSVLFHKSRGTVSSLSGVSNSDTIGTIEFLSYDGTAFYTTASINSFIDGVSGVADLPTRLTFRTTPDGDVSTVERMRIHSSGEVSIGSSNKLGQLAVDGTQDTIQLLIQGFSTQTNPLATFENSSGVDQVTIDNNGSTSITGIITMRSGTIQYNALTNDFQTNDDITIVDKDPHIQLQDTNGNDYEFYADGSQLYVSDVTTGIILAQFNGSGRNHTVSQNNLSDRTSGFFCPGALSTTMSCEEARPRIPANCTIQRVDVSMTTAPTGSSVTIDVNEFTGPLTGVSIWNITQSNRVTVAAGATQGFQTSFDNPVLHVGNFLGIDIDAIGSTTAGSDATVTVTCRF